MLSSSVTPLSSVHARGSPCRYRGRSCCGSADRGVCGVGFYEQGGGGWWGAVLIGAGRRSCHCGRVSARRVNSDVGFMKATSHLVNVFCLRSFSSDVESLHAHHGNLSLSVRFALPKAATNGQVGIVCRSSLDCRSRQDRFRNHRLWRICPLGPAYLPAYAPVRAWACRVGPHLLGCDPTQLGLINQRMDQTKRGHPYVKSALDLE